MNTLNKGIMDNNVKSKSIADLPVTDSIANSKIFVLKDGKVCWADVCTKDGGFKKYDEIIESLSSKINFLTGKLQESYNSIISLTDEVKKLSSEKNEEKKEVKKIKTSKK